MLAPGIINQRASMGSSGWCRSPVKQSPVLTLLNADYFGCIFDSGQIAPIRDFAVRPANVKHPRP
jgi:hypothetical protein